MTSQDRLVDTEMPATNSFEDVYDFESFLQEGIKKKTKKTKKTIFLNLLLFFWFVFFHIFSFQKI